MTHTIEFTLFIPHVLYTSLHTPHTRVHWCKYRMWYEYRGLECVFVVSYFSPAVWIFDMPQKKFLKINRNLLCLTHTEWANLNLIAKTSCVCIIVSFHDFLCINVGDLFEILQVFNSRVFDILCMTPQMLWMNELWEFDGKEKNFENQNVALLVEYGVKSSGRSIIYVLLRIGLKR